MENLPLKRSGIKIWVIAALFLTSPAKLSAQFFDALVPGEVVVQHAGSIGFFSVGAGYRVFKNKRGNVDMNYGFVPASKGGPLHILSAKFAYRPFEIRIKDWATIYPANPGAFVSYHFGKEFDFYWDKSQYEKGYYWWSSAIRPHLSLSNEVKLHGKKIARGEKIKSITLYSEFNTNELYLVSFFQNHGDLSMRDVFKLGIGVRVGF